MSGWNDFETKTEDANEENKGWDLISYSEYLEQTEEKEKDKITRPKELLGKNKDILKIVKYD